MEDVSKHSRVGGSQMGSNPGGIYHSPSGSKHYIKFPHNEQQARSEVASNKIHQLLGVNTLHASLVHDHGRVGVSTVFNPHIKNLGESYRKMSRDDAHEVAKIHHAAVLTKNWDSVGLEKDNIVRDHSTGHLHSVDHGGSFKFRAQGGHKEYGADISEIHSLRQHEPSASVYNHAFNNHPGVEKEALHGLRNLKHEDVLHAFKSSGVDEPEKMAHTLMQRRKSILAHYGE